MIEDRTQFREKEDLYVLRNDNFKWLLRRVFSSMVPISYFVGNASKVVCPFHQDTIPSAKIYSTDEDKIEKLYCFSCRRVYLSFDYLVRNSKMDALTELLAEFEVPDLVRMANIQQTHQDNIPDFVEQFRERWEALQGDLAAYIRQAYVEIKR